jgi:hypothetical protein
VSNIDIMLISKTHFTDRSYLRIPNYAVYHSDHPNGTAQGGSAIIINHSIKHHPLPSHNNDFLQATCLSMEDYRSLNGISCLPTTQTHS